MAPKKKITTDEQKAAKWDAHMNYPRKQGRLKQLCLVWVREHHPEIFQKLQQKCGLE